MEAEVGAFYDKLETRSLDQRAADLATDLPLQITLAQRKASGYGLAMADVDAAAVVDMDSLAKLPVLRKSELSAAQKAAAPLGGFAARAVSDFDHVFQSPGPIYEPGVRDADWWRMGRGLFAAGIGEGDVVQNCFSYHLTPAGMMFENGCAAVGATVLPAGVGQTELQVQAALACGVTAYVGTPDYLKIILDKADELSVDLSGLTKACVGGGALFQSLRKEYADRGISCLQGYATADLGSIAYESPARDGMIIDERVIVEIVTPGTGNPVAEGEVGEVVVTTLNPDYPLIRFATGDMSAIMSGQSPCGRTNTRIRGWMGRADQTAKIKGMFVRPEQVATLVERHNEVSKIRVVVSRDGEADKMHVMCEVGSGANVNAIEASVRDVLKLRGDVFLQNIGSLPNDGKVIDDQRNYD